MTRRTIQDACKSIRIACQGAMQRLGLSQADAGEIIGVSQPTVCRAVAATADPDTLLALILALATNGDVAAVEGICRASGGQFVAEGATVPASLRGTTWEAGYTQLMGQLAELLGRYAAAAADRRLSRGEHVGQADVLAQVEAAVRAMREAHLAAADAGGGERVDSVVRFVSPAHAG